MSRSPFDALVDSYDAARPGYPDGLFDALESLARPLSGARVAEVGAGTGIATRGLLARGARVAAFDIGPKMLARLRARHSGGALDAVAVADGHALPLRPATVDLVTYAQAFHWMRAPEAAAEARRVLRPGGALAVWWNNAAAQGEPWWESQQAAIEAGNPSFNRAYRVDDTAAGLRAGGFGSVEKATVPWARRLPVEDYLTYLASKSYVAALGEGLPAFLDARRTELSAAFPDGIVVEPFVTNLWVAR
jgi:SAM-dependent methyltransferase